MKKLILDTSTNLLYVGLINGDKRTFVTRVGKNDNAAYLVNKIDEVLKDSKLTIDDIEEIIVGIGPGSYTGVRVSVVVAKTLASTKNIKLKSISSLNLLSTGYFGLIIPAIDARRGHYFIGTYNNGKQVEKDEYTLIEDSSELIILNEETIKVNLDIVNNYAVDVLNVHDLEPNYLRKTEAENNYDKKNDN